VANGYSATPGIIAGNLTVSGSITTNTDAGIRIGAAPPFVRLYKDIGPGLGLSYNLGTDSATRDNTGLGAAELLETDTLNAPAMRIVNPAGTSFFRALDTTLAQDSTSVSHTGDTIETTLKTKLLPGNTLGAHGALLIELFWNAIVQGGVASAFRVKLGAQAVATSTRATATDFVQRVLMVADGGTANQRAIFYAIDATAVVTLSQSSTTLDTTLDQNFTVTFQGGAATDNWNLRNWRIHGFGGRTTAL